MKFVSIWLKIPHLFLWCREALGVVLHKDSKWYQQWKDFKDNNVVFNRKLLPNNKQAIYILNVLMLNL